MLETNANRKHWGKGDGSLLALQALGWILSDEKRAMRMLDLTGLTPDRLRDAIGSSSTQAAILSFLESHEPDLVACAGALNVPPEDFALARQELEA
jgi:hypothetical protein